MYEKRYKPERLPPEAERAISQKNLRTALTIARRIHETDPAAQQAEPTTQDERWELNAQLRLAETDALHAWADGSGLLLDADDFTQQ